MKKVFIAIITTEYGKIDEETIKEIKREAETGDMQIDFYELEKVNIISLEN